MARRKKNNVDSGDEYVVEKIIGKRKDKGVVLYRVKWKDYDEKESTWEPIENLQNVKKEIRNFELKEERKAARKNKEGPSIVPKLVSNGSDSKKSNDLELTKTIDVSNGESEEESNTKRVKVGRLRKIKSKQISIDVSDTTESKEKQDSIVCLSNKSDRKSNVSMKSDRPNRKGKVGRSRKALKKVSIAKESDESQESIADHLVDKAEEGETSSESAVLSRENLLEKVKIACSIKKAYVEEDKIFFRLSWSNSLINQSLSHLQFEFDELEKCRPMLLTEYLKRQMLKNRLK